MLTHPLFPARPSFPPFTSSLSEGIYYLTIWKENWEFDCSTFPKTNNSTKTLWLKYLKQKFSSVKQVLTLVNGSRWISQYLLKMPILCRLLFVFQTVITQIIQNFGYLTYLCKKFNWKKVLKSSNFFFTPFHFLGSYFKQTFFKTI